MSQVNEILGLLENGEWHSLKEIAEKTRLDEFKIKNVTSFLVQHDFIELDEGKQRIKLEPSTLRFLKKIRLLHG